MTQSRPPERLVSYLQKSGIALAISDASKDAPLVAVNDAFCTLTGYPEADVLDRNCRFLQGPETTEEMRQPLHDFVQGKGPDADRFSILNYRKDGSTFHNYVFMTRLRDTRGLVQFILASQFDMTSAVKRERVHNNDATLQRALTDMDQIGQEFGLAMVESAKLLSDSVAVMARLALKG